MPRARLVKKSDKTGATVAIFSCSAVALVVLFGVSTGVVGVASADCYEHFTPDTTAPEPDGSVRPNLTYPPSNMTVSVTVVPGGDRWVKLNVEYPARSEAEAESYENGTIDLSWLEADDRTETAFQARNESFYPCDISPGVTDPVASSSPYGDVGVIIEYDWHTGFDANQSKLVYGPTISEHLPDGTVVELEVDDSKWNAESTTVRSFTTGAHGQGRAFRWVVNQTETEPRVVFNRSVLETETRPSEDGPLGPGGGVGLTVLAILIAVALAARRDG